jgi:phosphoglycerate dehydrogenase-like enzyme
MLADGVSFEAVPSLDIQDFARLADKADVLFVIHRHIDAQLLALAPRARLIQRNSIGYENIDLEAATAAGIPVAYTPGANAGAVAEHTIMLMLVLTKRFVTAEQATRSGRWPQMELAQAGIGDLAGSTIGLVGLGHTGRAVAERLTAFGSRLVYHTRHRADAAVEEKCQATYTSLPELLASSQIVSLHLPLSEATHHFIGDEQLARMPRGSFLINVSRGGLVDEAALRRAIESGHLAGAGLDTVEQEGEGGNPFADLPQVIVTPHTAGPSRRGIDALLQRSFANINRVLTGASPIDLVPGIG